ncbi:MAG: glycosyltransferase family 4 protein [Actinobacteria bacterium]|nr:glycosyltransferase family 4 protein [Actinomycetota bacterium]
MRIGIDISTLLNHGHDIGAGRYIYNLLKGLFELETKENSNNITTQNKFQNKLNEGNKSKKDTFILTARYTTDDYTPILTSLIERYSEAKIKLRLYRVTPKKLNLWNRFGFPPIEFRGFKADLLHCPDFLIPPTLNKNIILTIHDLAFIRFPQFNFDWFIKKYTKEVKKNALRAKKIIAVSNSTKNDIISFFGIEPGKIEVIYEAVDEVFKKLEQNEIRKEILGKYNIKGKYILSVGTIEPRKNFPTLIKAFNLVKEKVKEKIKDLKLVIAGRTGWKSEATYEEREKSPYKEDILFIGRVSDEDLCQLYNQAELFVYPSIFEGFGLPPLEAMRCGLPVIASDCPSLKEVVGDAGILISSNDFEAISENVIKLLLDNNLREKLKEKSLSQAKKFSWEKTAIKTLNTYRNILQYM